MLLQIWSASLLQRALQACLYSSMKNQPVFLKAVSQCSENGAVLSLSVCGEGRRREVLVQRQASCTSWSLMPALFGYGLLERACARAVGSVSPFPGIAVLSSAPPRSSWGGKLRDAFCKQSQGRAEQVCKLLSDSVLELQPQKIQELLACCMSFLETAPGRTQKMDFN